MALDRKVAPPARPIRHVDFLEAETTLLSNGIPVHMIRSGKQAVVGLELVFRHGGIRHGNKNGVAFFTFKMLAEGTQQKDSDTISNEIDKYGAFLQLSPGLDYSSVDLYMLSRYADPLLATLRELITESTFPAGELRKLKKIQQQHLRVNNKKSSVLASKTFKATLFGEQHPYGASLTEEAITAIEQEDLRTFFQHHLKNKLEIIVSGDVSTEVLEAIESHFGDLPIVEAYPTEDKLPPTALSMDKRVIVERSDNLQSSIRMGRPLFTKAHSDYHKMQVLNTILGGYFGSRLMRNIREDKGLTYGISSGLVSLCDAGYFVIGTEVKKENTAHVFEEIYKEMAYLREVPLGDTELNTVKNYMAGRLLSSVDTPFALAEKFKNIHLYGLTYNFYKNHLNTINTIDAASLQEMAQKYLTEENMREVVVGAY
ncbi:M16 family metallopeptidase [Catalinimonas niigatensis]|uniref:M16 family metallopeptidase n=1 Tax=Catalinimonas niigatensis TaxID=1397264 RepID=UPI00266705E1|nr:pitrilysin family protein [Catalinimonas niigatensis]WPP48889.1 pitrilysin family protein [Catalinimonas niigatensis]